MFLRLMVAALALTATAQAQTSNKVYWTSEPLKLTVTSANSNANYSAKFRQVSETTTYYDCSGIVDDGTGQWVQQEHEVIVSCSGGAGKSEAWDAYFSAKKAAKADRLAAAIKGIGKSSAQSLIDAGYFSSKPRSWQEFSSTITRASQEGVISAQVASMVLSKFGSDNRETLGYSGSACQTKTVVENVWVSNAYYKQKTCTDVQENVIDIKNVDFQINVANAVLLPQEREEINLTLTADPQDVRVSDGYYNRYTATAEEVGHDTTVININGIARKLVNLPSQALQATKLDYVASERVAKLTLDVDPRFLANDGSGALVVDYVLWTCKINWLGTCILSLGEKAAPVTVTLNDVHTVVDVPVPTGHKAQVVVSLRKENSKYYNVNTVDQNTNTIKAK